MNTRRASGCLLFACLFGAAASSLLACSPAGTFSPGHTTTRAAAPRAVAFVDVSVVPIASEGILEHQTVIVEGKVIMKMGPQSTVRAPEGTQVIDGRGKFLMPGMIDMHVHLPDDPKGDDLRRILALMASEGITTVRSMQGAASHLEFRAHAKSDYLVPTLILAGPPISEAITGAAARELVRSQKNDGYDAVKLLGGIDKPVYLALTDEAKKTNFPVVGHVPAEVGIDVAIAAKQKTIEHLMGYDVAKREPAALEALAQKTAAAKITNCPTLDYFGVMYAKSDDELMKRPGLEFVRREQIDAWRKDKAEKPPKEGASLAPFERMVVILATAGAPLVVGSDSPGDYRVPGFSYVEELERMVHAGLTAPAVLRAATRTAAESLGKTGHMGSIAEGMDADLVLLDKDPTANVRNVAHPAGVMMRGTWLPRADLDQRVREYRTDLPATDTPEGAPAVTPPASSSQ